MEQGPKENNYDITYTLAEDGILYPNISFEQDTDYVIGKYGMMIGEYVMANRRGEYIRKINEGSWNRYLHEIDEECHEQIELIMERIKETEGVMEQLKEADPMEWVRRVNEIKMRAERVVLERIVLWGFEDVI